MHTFSQFLVSLATFKNHFVSRCICILYVSIGLLYVCFGVVTDRVSSWDNQGGEEMVTPIGRGEGRAFPVALWRIERH